MSWDSSRPVPWQRLFKEAALYAALVGAVFLLVFRDQPAGSMVSGLVFGTLLYLTVGWVMAKLGIERKTAAERRAEAAARKADQDPGTSNSSKSSRSAQQRSKPAPTRRTNAPTTKTTQKRRKR